MRFVRRALLATCLLAAVGVLPTACGRSNGTGPGSANDPIVLNAADNFLFQWNDLRSFTGTRQFTWINNGDRAEVTQSSADILSLAPVNLIVVSPGGTEVYRGDLRTNGTFPTLTTRSGSYTIRVEAHNASGTLKFNVINAAAEPAITNVPDDFQFQWTNVTSFTRSREYTWSNTGTSATITQSSSGLTSPNPVTLIIRNPAGAEVYRGDLRTNGTFQSVPATSGNYIIRVEFVDATGTINFRVQKGG